jgi:hypothetical protein
MGVAWFKTKDMVRTKIKPISGRTIEEYLDKGFTIGKVTTSKKGTNIMTYSPKSREQAYAEHKQRNPMGRF